MTVPGGRRLWPVAVAFAVAVAGVGLWQCRDRDQTTVSDGGTTSRSSLADQLRARPKRVRWSTPLCTPTGTVTLPDGAPAAGAVVALQAEPLSRQVATVPIDEPDTVTGPDGKFQLPAVAAGTWRLVAASVRYRAASRDVVLSDAADCKQLDIKLGPAGQPVTGHVFDVSGGPIKGALVIGRATVGPPTTTALATTNEDGRYELAVAPGDYTMAVRHPQYVGIERGLAVRGATTFDAVLTPGGEVRGVVLTRDKREPVAGARVTIRGGRASGAMGGLVREVVSDDDGRFVVPGLGSGRAWVAAVGPNHASREPLELALGIAESRAEIEVLVDPARRIRGIVARDGKPVSDALVFAILDSGSPEADQRMAVLADAEAGMLSIAVDNDGVFELWGLAPAKYQLTANAPQTVGSEAVMVDVTARDADGVELTLGRGAVIRGRVEPPQVAHVSLTEVSSLEASERWVAQSEVITDATGQFELRGAETGEVTVYARTDDGLIGESLVEVPERGVDGVVVKLASQGVVVAGRVVDTNGRPVAGASISDWGVVSSSDGTFRAASVMPGTYELSVAVDEDSLSIISPKVTDSTIEVPATGISDLAITVEPSDRTMRGVVVTADGKPAADAWVVAVAAGSLTGEDIEEPAEGGGPDLSSTTFDWTGRKHIALTDAQGRFAIGGLRATSYDVAAEGERGNARGVAANVTADKPVRVQLTTLASLTVMVTANGQPSTHFQLEVSGPEPDYRTVLSADGVLTMRGKPPGEYEVRASVDDASGVGKVTLPQGASASVTVALEPFATLVGRCVDAASGKPAAGVFVYAEGAFPDPATVSITDSEGRFEIRRVPAGTGELQLWSDGPDGRVTIPYSARPGQRVDVGTHRVKPPELPPDAPPPAGSDDGEPLAAPGSGAGETP